MTKKNTNREFKPLPRGPKLPNGRRMVYMPPELLREGAGGVRIGSRQESKDPEAPKK